MNIAAMLTLQSLPFAGIVLATSEDRDLFLLFYISCVGLILTLVALFGEPIIPAASLDALMDSLGSE